METKPQKNTVSQETLLVIRDETGAIKTVISKNGVNVSVYECSVAGFEEVKEILEELIK